MRASRAWPRSSVPKGCTAEGTSIRAVKSISLIGTRQSAGPSTTARPIASRTIVLATARRWRRKRRQASSAGETWGASSRLAPASAVSDAGVEPAIEHVRNHVEQDHQAREHEAYAHGARGVVREDRIDEQRADARHAENLLGDDGASEDRGDLQRHQRDDGDQRIDRKS